MSCWQEITDKDDIDISLDGESLHVLISSDDLGNNYISIPIEFVKESLKTRIGPEDVP